MSTLWGLVLAKKSCNNINKSRAQVSRLYVFLRLWVIPQHLPSSGGCNFKICCKICLVWLLCFIWDKVFKNRPSKIWGRQPLKYLKGYGLLKQTISLQNFWRLSSTNITWSILEYFIPFALLLISEYVEKSKWVVSSWYVSNSPSMKPTLTRWGSFSN